MDQAVSSRIVLCMSGVSDLIDRFEEMLVADKNLAPQTISSYKSDIKKFLKIYNIDVCKNDVGNYIEKLREDGLKQSSILRNVTSLKNFFMFLHDECVISRNPTENIRLKNKDKPLPKVVSEDEMRLLISKFESSGCSKLKSMLHILYGAGLRVSELVELRTDSITIDDETGRISLIIRGKGGRERVLPLHEVAVRTILDYIRTRTPVRGNNFLFPSSSRLGHITRQGFAKTLKKFATEAGIPGPRISPHVVRHAFATHLLANGANILVIQKLLGHKDISTTQIYTHVSNEKIRKIVENNPNLAKLNILKQYKEVR
jgi:integrase/recombinase XerD